MSNKPKRQTEEYDYIIIGAGPAGLQLGYYFEKAAHNYLILEAGDTPGTFFKKFPRHRTLISSNKIFTGHDINELNLRWDWNSLLSDSEQLLFKNYSKRYFPEAELLVKYLTDFAAHFELKIRYSVKVTKVTKRDVFIVTDSNHREYRCRRLIIASGLTKPYIPPISGIELVEQYSDISIDPGNFINQKVLIIGKGNSGFETAENLIETAAVIHVASPSPLKFAWKTHFVGHLRAVNNNFLDTYQLKSQNAVIDASIEKISMRDGKLAVNVSYSHASGECEEIIYDRVIACTGFRFDDSIFDESCRPELMEHKRFPKMNSEWESSNIEDLYFAGTLMQIRDFKKKNSGFIHGFRYNIRALAQILEKKYHGRPWPSRIIEASPEKLTQSVISRLNQSSGLWQQFGFLCDLITISPQGGGARYYEEVPVDYIRESEISQETHYYTAILEFGDYDGDPFNILRHPDPSCADKSVFLHPIIRCFEGSKMISELQLLEDLNGVWLKEKDHIIPLQTFFTNQLVKAYSFNG